MVGDLEFPVANYLILIAYKINIIRPLIYVFDDLQCTGWSAAANPARDSTPSADLVRNDPLNYVGF